MYIIYVPSYLWVIVSRHSGTKQIHEDESIVKLIGWLIEWLVGPGIFF